MGPGALTRDQTQDRACIENAESLANMEIPARGFLPERYAPQETCWRWGCFGLSQWLVTLLALRRVGLRKLDVLQCVRQSTQDRLVFHMCEEHFNHLSLEPVSISYPNKIFLQDFNAYWLCYLYSNLSFSCPSVVGWFLFLSTYIHTYSPDVGKDLTIRHVFLYVYSCSFAYWNMIYVISNYFLLFLFYNPLRAL